MGRVWPRFCAQSMAQSDMLIQRSKDHLQHRQVSPKQPCRSNKRTILLIKRTAQHCCTHTSLPGLQRDRTDTRIAPAWPRWHTLFVPTARAHSHTATPGPPIRICRKNGRFTLPMALFTGQQTRPHMSSPFHTLQMAPCFCSQNIAKFLALVYPNVCVCLRAATYFVMISCTL